MGLSVGGFISGGGELYAGKKKQVRSEATEIIRQNENFYLKTRSARGGGGGLK